MQAYCAKYIKMEMSDSTKVLCIRLFLFSIYVLVGAATFQAIERQEQVREVERIRITRNEILTKYNITQNDAQRWSKTFLSTSLGNDDFLEWNFGNSFLFAMVVLTTIGKISEKSCTNEKIQPLKLQKYLKTLSFIISYPCVVCDLNIYLTYITFFAITFKRSIRFLNCGIFSSFLETYISCTIEIRLVNITVSSSRLGLAQINKSML